MILKSEEQRSRGQQAYDRNNEVRAMRISPEAPAQSLRSCEGFRPAPVQARSCGLCGHSWVLHALEKLGPRRASGCGPVEVAVPGLVLDLSSLVLYGAQAVPVRLKILLDRLYSVLTPDQVGHILHTLGWSLGDYVRGYKLQDLGGRSLDHWLMVSPQEERLILRQFLRFGETRPIVQLMTGSMHTEDDHRKNHCKVSSATYATSPAKDPISPYLPAVQKSSLASGSPGALSVKPDPDTPPPTAAPELEPPLSPLATLGYSLSPSYKHTFTSVSPAFFCPPLTPGGSLLALPHSGASITGRKGRVCCGVCGKSFYDKGTLKIHYNAVHLKIKHRCTVSGCTMVFSSLRSRNRHSANPNPRLHTCTGPPSAHPGPPAPRLHNCPAPSKNQGAVRKVAPTAMDNPRDDELHADTRLHSGYGLPKNQGPFHKSIPKTTEKLQDDDRWQRDDLLFQWDASPLQQTQVTTDPSSERFSPAPGSEDAGRDNDLMSEYCLSKRQNLNAGTPHCEMAPKKKSRKSSVPVKIERQRLGEM